MVAVLEERLEIEVSPRRERTEEIQEGMWYRYYRDFKPRNDRKRTKTWVKAADSGAAHEVLNYEVLGEKGQVLSLCAEKWRTMETYFIPAAFEKAERLEKQLERERGEGKYEQ